MPGAELKRLLAEIHEQPEVIQRLLDSQLPMVRQAALAIRERQPTAIVLVARGSSDHAAIYGRYVLEICNRRLISLAAPSEVTLYASGPRLADTVVIGVSQSGRGDDVVSYVQEARKQGALTVAIVNDESSPLAAAAERVLPCSAGPEVSVPATKTVTSEMTLLAMLSASLEDADGADARLAGLPAAVGRALEQRPAVAELAAALSQTTLGSVIGRGFAFPPALEIALKLKETSYTRAEAISAADFMHGPVAVVEAGYSALLIDVGGRSSAAALELATAVRQRGGQSVLLRSGELSEVPADLPNVSLRVPLAEAYAPIVVLVLGQLLAIELALALGVDPALPRGLHKVTSTR
jgi:glutamine---fructose-6-phosphate transaminase (isomerizing)